jgi:hypothetical protein
VWSLLTHPPCRCIELAPDFTKGYSRKGTLQYFMKDYEKALATYEAGLKQEPDNQELKDGLMRCLEAIDRLAHGEGGWGGAWVVFSLHSFVVAGLQKLPGGHRQAGTW